MKLFLAPLAGFTDAPFRRLCREGGADLVYTEMVSAAALYHGSSPTRHLMETMPGEGPVACQIFGREEKEIAFAAAEIEKIKDRFVEINLNAGCPMPRIVESGCGAKLMEDPSLIFRLLKAMRENTSLPATLKTRLGMHKAEPVVMELLDAAEKAGASRFILHARSAGQKHGGPVDLEAMAEVARRASIPVCGNGSVSTKAGVDAMAAAGVDAVMIGRAALAEPGIFARLKGIAPGVAASGPEAASRHLEYILEFRKMLEEKYPADHVPDEDGFASVKMHTHLFRYFAGLPGAAKMRRGLSLVRTLAEVRALLSRCSLRETSITGRWLGTTP